MKFATLATALTLAAAPFLGAAHAATVSATFDGFTTDGAGLGLPVGSAVSVELIGEDDAPVVGSALPSFTSGTADSLSVFNLTSFSISAGGQTYTSTMAQLFVGDNVDADGEPEIGDYIYAEGPSPGGGMLQYVVKFDRDTFSGSQFTTAVAQGLALSPTQVQGVRFENPTGFFEAEVALTDLAIIATPPTGGGGTAGGGGSSGGNGGTPTPAPIPLPAGLPLLAMGLGAFGFLRFKP